jgi:hypothetical protein
MVRAPAMARGTLHLPLLIATRSPRSQPAAKDGQHFDWV